MSRPGNLISVITRAASSPPPAPTAPATADWLFSCAVIAPNNACAIAFAATLFSPTRALISFARYGAAPLAKAPARLFPANACSAPVTACAARCISLPVPYFCISA
ncbi:hypothetical protein D3C74_418540 [compost metagenome]